MTMQILIILLSVAAYSNANPCFGSRMVSAATGGGAASVGTGFASDFLNSEVGFAKNGLATGTGMFGSLLKGDISGTLNNGVGGVLKTGKAKIGSQLGAVLGAAKGGANIGSSIGGNGLQDILSGGSQVASGDIGGISRIFTNKDQGSSGCSCGRGNGNAGAIESQRTYIGSGQSDSSFGGSNDGVSTGGSRYVITETSNGGSSGAGYNYGGGNGNGVAIDSHRIYHTSNGLGGSGGGAYVTQTTTNVGGSSLGSSGGSYIVDASAPGSSNGGSTVTKTATYGGSSGGGSSGGGLLGLGSGSNGGGMGFGFF